MTIIKSDYKPQGLFANIICQLIEILPYLENNNIYPEFVIRSKTYGRAHNDYNIFPELLMVKYEVSGTNETMLEETLRKDPSVMKYKGQLTFDVAHCLFHKYFAFPEALHKQVDSFASNIPFPPDQLLGIHYRGTDKMKPSPTHTGYAESSYLSYEDFDFVVRLFIQKHPDIKGVFLATDKLEIIERVRADLGIPVFNFKYNFSIKSNLCFHKNKNMSEDERLEMGKSAIRDVIMLSRCKYMLKHCSQMSAFAKVLNPTLESYRLNTPNYGWFPDAHIPPVDFF